MERPEQDAGPSTRAAIAAGSAVPGRRAGSLPGPASSLTASLPLDSGSKATAPAPARAPSFQPNLEPLRSTLTLEFSCLAADLTLEQFRERLIPKPSLIARFDERLRLLDHPPGDQAYFFLADLLPDTEAQTTCQGEIETESAQLQEGYGSPRLLERAAQAYFGNAADTPGESPGDRLGRFVGSRTDLAANLRTGLLGVPGRDDLPAPSGVVAGCVRGEMPPLTFPFMAALDELDWSGRLEVSRMSDGLVGLAVTILHSVPADRLTPDRHDPLRTFPPSWLSQLLQDRPRPVADVLTRAIRQKLAMRVLPASEVQTLVRRDHRDVAALVCQPLLRTFPGESGVVYLEALGWLLTAALKSCDGYKLERTIWHRLRNEELPEAQRIYWAAAGFLLAPCRYSRELQGFTNEPDRLGALLDFQCRMGFPHQVARRFEASELRLLIAMTGVAMAGVELTASRREVMSDLIRGLSPLLTQEAVEILQELKDDPDFAPWALDISLAIEDQSARRRMREFRPCGIDQVARTLENGRPANAGDLAALVAAEIAMLAHQMRDGSASFWKHFWNVDRYNRATDPRPEESCRDASLFALQRRLDRLGIDAQPEGTYADDTRSDIRDGVWRLQRSGRDQAQLPSGPVDGHQEPARGEVRSRSGCGGFRNLPRILVRPGQPLQANCTGGLGSGGCRGA